MGYSLVANAVEELKVTAAPKREDAVERRMVIMEVVG
jgi:hypothetical protein